MITATAPDGSRHNFPDGTDDAVIDRAMQEYIAGIKQPKEPGLLEQAGSAVKGFAKGAYNMVTGADRMTDEVRRLPEGIQEPSPSIGANLRGGIGYAAASDDTQRRQIMEQNYPGIEFRQDAKGNTIGKYNGKEFVLNKPGLSQTDILPAALQGVAYTYGAMGGAKLAPWLGRALGVGAGAAGTSVALDTTANAGGAKKGLIDIGKSAGMAGVTGAGFELAAPAVAKLYQAVRSRGAEMTNMAGGLTPQAKEAMREAGINPDDLSDEFMGILRNYTGKMDDTAAARLSQGQSLPVPIQQTRGQLTMDPQAQRLEEAMRAGSYGETAGQRMRGVAGDQQAQIGQNLDAIQSGMSGGQRQVVQRGQGGEMVSNRLNQLYDTQKAGVDAAYDAARNAPPAFVQPDVAASGVNRVATAVKQNHDLLAVPRVASGLDQLAALAPDGATPANIKGLFQWRQRMSNVRANGGQEAVAAKDALREFDAFVNEAVDNALMSGDDAAVALWRDAIAKNREFAQRFKGNDLVGKLTLRVYDTDSRQLAVDPTSAVNYILGQAKMGPAGKQNIVPNMKKLRDTLGADSQEWNALREEAFMRFASAGKGASPGGVEQFSGVNFKTNWTNAWQKDAPLMSQLFTQREKQIIDQFADVSARVTSQTKYGGNPSGTSYAMNDLLLKLPFGRKLRDFLKEAEGASRASQALKVPYKEIPAGYLGAGGATAGTRDY